MIKRKFPAYWFVFFGVAAFLLLQLHYALAWTSYYARFPYRGSERAMAEGHIPPSMSGSPRSTLVAGIVLVLLPLATLRLRRGRRRWCVLALWAGVMSAVIGVWIGTPRLREESNLWPLDLAFLLFITGILLLVGAFAQLLVEARRGPAKQRPGSG